MLNRMYKFSNRLLPLFFLIFMVPQFLFSMEIKDTTETIKRFSVGIRTGLNLSDFQMSPVGSGPHGYSLTVNDENRARAGFSFGLFLDVKSNNHFSLQPEVNYIRIRHNINYSEWRRGYPVGSITNTDYTLTGSIIQFSLLPGFSFGKNSNLKIFTGPFCRVPVLVSYNGTKSKEDDLLGGLGAIFGLRVDFPVKSDFLSFELRAGTDLTNIMSTPVPVKETSVTFSLAYLFKLKLRDRVNYPSAN